MVLGADTPPPTTDADATLLGICGDAIDFGELIDDAVGEDTDEALECCLCLSFFMKCSAPPKPFLRSVPPTDFILNVVCRYVLVERRKRLIRSASWI